MPQFKIEQGQLHPCVFRDAFGLSTPMTAVLLELSEQSIKAYSYQPTANSRRDPGNTTLSRTYDKCKLMLLDGQKPTRPDLLPQELQSLVIA